MSGMTPVGQKGQTGQQEAVALPYGRHDEPGNAGADDARQIEHGRVQGDRIGQEVGPIDHLADARLSRGHVEGVDGTQKNADHEDNRIARPLGQSQEPHEQGDEEEHELRRLNQALLVDAIDQGPGEKAQDEDRDLARKIVGAGPKGSSSIILRFFSGSVTPVSLS